MAAKLTQHKGALNNQNTGNDDVQKVFVASSGAATFKCPHCGEIKHAYVKHYKGAKNYLKVKCSCKGVFSIYLDFRRKYRKDVQLQGTYLNLPLGKRWGPVLVKNLSMTGIGFDILGPHNIKNNQELLVRFTLDDNARSEIEKKVVVKLIKGHFIGAEFLNMGAYEKALGFYLLN